MKEYYIHLNGKKQGPFSLHDLQQQENTPDSLVWCTDSATWVPACQIEELKPMFEKEPPSGLKPHVTAPPDADKGQQRGGNLMVGRSAVLHRGIRIAVISLLVMALGMAIYYLVNKPDVTRRKDGAPQKDEIRAIHEQEVQKAKQELNAEKLAKKKAEARKELLLKARKAELQSLKAQLRQVTDSKANALSDLDDIRGLHLFRSRAKKEEQLSAQLQVIDRLDTKATSLRNRIGTCQVALDTLMAGAQP